MPKALNIQNELAVLEAMAPRQLREKYLALFGEPTRSGNRRFMIKRIAWRLQADAEGGLPERVRQKALELARDSDLRMTAPRAATGSGGGGGTVDRLTRLHSSRIPTPGTQLTRVYKGKPVFVTVLANGFEHDGKKYLSLSAAAKAITGSHISGNAFFRLAGPRDSRKQETTA